MRPSFIHREDGSKRFALFATIALTAMSSSAAAQCLRTPTQTEGPYYRTPNPLTTDMRAAGEGPLLTLNGQVVDRNCNPIPYAWLAIWHTDANGVYDNVEPFDRYRCNFFSDASGAFSVKTIIPGLYPGRTRHLHLKADTPHTELLTTQLYFPNEPLNATDAFYDPELEMTLEEQPDGSFIGAYEVHLRINGDCPAPEITRDPNSVTTTWAANVRMSVTATGVEPFGYQWRRDGVPLEDGDIVDGAQSSELYLWYAVCSFAGTYDCVVFSSCGEAVSAPAELAFVNCCAGDLNHDGDVDIKDVASAVSFFGLTKASPEHGDMDGDGDVDLADLAALLSVYGEPCDP